MTETTRIRAYTLNAKGLVTERKRKKIFRWLHEQKHHFCIIQETHSTKEKISVFETDSGAKSHFCETKRHFRKV